MTRQSKFLVGSGVLALLVLTAPLVAGQGSAVLGLVRACVVPSTGAVRLLLNPLESCRSTEKLVTWNQTGPQGPVGPVGPVGPQGPAGPAGSAGGANGGGDAGAATPIGQVIFPDLGGGTNVSRVAEGAGPALIAGDTSPITELGLGILGPDAAGFVPRGVDGRQFEPVTLTKKMNPKSPKLLEMAAGQRQLDQVIVQLCHDGNCASGLYYQVELKEVIISGIQQRAVAGGQTDPTPAERLQLSFHEARWSVIEGGVTTGQGCWSLGENRSC